MNFWHIALSCCVMVSAPPASAAPAPIYGEEAQRIRSAAVNGVTIAYSVTGPEEGRPILLIPGIGVQLIEWPPEIIEELVSRGFRVIAYEHRDTGSSSHFAATGVPDFAAMAAGKEVTLPYSAADMRDDAIALLEHLRIDRADILGISGGATIGSLVALERPELVRSLSLIAANSGNPAVAIPAQPDRLAGLPQPHPDESHADRLRRRVATARALAARDATFDETRMRAVMEQALKRDRDPYGFARQGAALLALGDIREKLPDIEAPTLVVHGADDPLIAPQLGREVSEAIPRSQFLLLTGMGHDVPPEHARTIVEEIAENSAKVK